MLLLISTMKLCSYNKTPMQDKEVFEYKDEKGYDNYIEIQKLGDSLRGFFFGVELNKDNVPVFFKASFSYPLSQKFVETENINEIYFKLTKFDISFNPFKSKADNSNLIKTEKDIPFILTRPIVFFGKRRGNNLELNRVLDVYDSKSDRLVFSKVIR
jgi:hypothetical protein